MSSDEPTDDLPTGLSAPARRALEGAGYTRLAQLTEVSEKDVLALHGIGPKPVGLIRQALADRGLSFKDG